MRGAAALLLAIASAGAAAGEINSFALEFGHTQLPLDDGTELESDTLGLRYSESSILPFRLEAALGREGVNHNGDSAALGFQPEGFYIGLDVDAATPRWNGFQAGATLGYSYHNADQQLGRLRLEIDWFRATARGWVAFHFNDMAKLYGCVTALNVSGDQSVAGATPEQVSFGNQHQSGYCGGLTLETGDGGYFGLEVESRTQSGVRLYFGKRYSGF